MSIGKAIHSRLSAHSGTSALVSARIYPMRLPQPPTYPAVRYQVIGAPRTHAMGVDTGEVHARVQVDCYATTYSGVRALADQVRLALNRWGDTAGGVVVDHVLLDEERDADEPTVVRDGERGVYRVMMDFLAHYQEAVA